VKGVDKNSLVPSLRKREKVEEDKDGRRRAREGDKIPL
jgi:hypothetical protein